MSTIRLTMAQALVRYLAAQRVEQDGEEAPLFAGVWAIFGHGNVAGLGEALQQAGDSLPTWRAHNEQGMAHAAIAYAKAHFRRRMMAVTSSIGPGATNLVTAAALAHVNRLPLLLLPGDVFVSRAPDPVLQQLEAPQDGTLSVNDCLRPVSRYFDRIVHPAQLLTALPRALAVLTDPAQCGPATLALPQDVQTMAWDYPTDWFRPRLWRIAAPPPEPDALEPAARELAAARRQLIVAGGGVRYNAGGAAALRAFAERDGAPLAETQAGKSALPWDHPLQLGAIGVTGSPAANRLAERADLVLALGSRLQDFSTGSGQLFRQARLLSVNVNALDGIKADAVALSGDAALCLDALSARLDSWSADAGWSAEARALAEDWRAETARVTGQRQSHGLPYDGEVIGAVQRHPSSERDDIVVCAAGTLPAELHKLWRAATPGGYHLEYGYSCMGYEIAGGLGVKMARPEREVIVMVGDGSYLMMNSELATSVMLDRKLIVVLLDNRGYGCINRLQQACGGAPFNNLLDDCRQGRHGAPRVDFAAHARALGAEAEHVADIAGLEAALLRARAAERSYLIVIDTDPARTTEAGGCWWEVAVPEVSERAEVRAARQAYEDRLRRRQYE
ncbi:3D-(3,5/4)-trihydroxycyclohexane-1,2-dione acylhydrolase (decyclizing) [Chromobacterium aquaticum]|uniref:3D-(3,5/4)-trihydroxycyclohexane-1,2-dione acylhydrolase (Decyclizing) n=1 Tax=Chromobacterium aquaticum TaxID=467180 RepID=A0ABV8ZZA8_9NEIS